MLRDALPSAGQVLEVASGTGEHAVHFARTFPHLDWQPSDPDEAALRSIQAWRAQVGLPNLRAPIRLDVRDEDWPTARADAILCINMVHISPWAATQALMKGARRQLPGGGLLYLYGPYRRAGIPTAPSNEAFDLSLKARDPSWGLRSLEEVVERAAACDLELDRVVEMPANNLSVLFRRR